jgi:hypothetical protein
VAAPAGATRCLQGVCADQQLAIECRPPLQRGQLGRLGRRPCMAVSCTAQLASCRCCTQLLLFCPRAVHLRKPGRALRTPRPAVALRRRGSRAHTPRGRGQTPTGFASHATWPGLQDVAGRQRGADVHLVVAHCMPVCRAEEGVAAARGVLQSVGTHSPGRRCCQRGVAHDAIWHARRNQVCVVLAHGVSYVDGRGVVLTPHNSPPAPQEPLTPQSSGGRSNITQRAHACAIPPRAAGP